MFEKATCAMDGAVTNALAGVLSQTKLQAIKSAGMPILWQTAMTDKKILQTPSLKLPSAILSNDLNCQLSTVNCHYKYSLINRVNYTTITLSALAEIQIERLREAETTLVFSPKNKTFSHFLYQPNKGAYYG